MKSKAHAANIWRRMATLAGGPVRFGVASRRSMVIAATTWAMLVVVTSSSRAEVIVSSKSFSAGVVVNVVALGLYDSDSQGGPGVATAQASKSVSNTDFSGVPYAAQASGSSDVNVDATVAGGNISIGATATGTASGINQGSSYPPTYGQALASGNGNVVYSTSTQAKVWVMWSVRGDLNTTAYVYVTGINNTQLSGSTAITLSAGQPLNLGLHAQTNYAGTGIPLGPGGTFSGTRSIHGSMHWSIDASWPGEEPSNPIKTKGISTTDAATIIKESGNVDIANDVTGSYLTSFPVGEQGIGTTQNLYASFPLGSSEASDLHLAASLPMATPLAAAVATQDLIFAALGSEFASFTLLTDLLAPGELVLLSAGGSNRWIQAGEEFSFLDHGLTGVTQFRLSGLPEGVFGEDLLAAFRFTEEADVTLAAFVITVPEPGTLVLAGLGLAMLFVRRPSRWRRAV